MAFLNSLLMSVLLLTTVFLIVLVLIQRGRGGGLAGAFGGMGGQSAFGTKAGDLFTKITIGVASFWILLCMFIVWHLGGSSGQSVLSDTMGSAAPGATGAAVAPMSGQTPAESPAGGAPAAAESSSSGNSAAVPGNSSAPGDSAPAAPTGGGSDAKTP